MSTFTKNAIIGSYFLFLALAALYVIQESSRLEKSYRNIGNEVACTMEAKLCPDGSAVGRVGSSCEFAPCPGSAGGASMGEGTLSGKVSIGPLCPVEPCRGGAMSNPYTERELILQSENGDLTLVPLGTDGKFETLVKAGTYTMNLSDCVFMGCAPTLPKTITIETGKTTQTDIDIDTGIR